MDTVSDDIPMAIVSEVGCPSIGDGVNKAGDWAELGNGRRGGRSCLDQRSGRT